MTHKNKKCPDGTNVKGTNEFTLSLLKAEIKTAEDNLMTLWEDLILLAELLCTASVKKKGCNL